MSPPAPTESPAARASSPKPHDSKRAADTRLAELETRARKEQRSTPAISLDAMITRWRKGAGHAASTARNYDLAVVAITAKVLGAQIATLRVSTIDDVVAKAHRITACTAHGSFTP